MSSETQYDWISALVDGQLAGQELLDARRNLAEDADARKLFEQLQSMRADLKSLPELKLGNDFTDRVMQQIGKSQSASTVLPRLVVKPKATHWRMTLGIFSGVAALLLIGLVILFNRPREDSDVAVDSLNKKKAPAETKSHDESIEQNQDMPVARASEIADQPSVDSVQDESSAGLRTEESRIVADPTTSQSGLKRKVSADADTDDLPLQDKFADRSKNGAPPLSADLAIQPFGAASESLHKEVEQLAETAEVFVAFARLKAGGNAQDVRQLLELAQIEFAQTEHTTPSEKAAAKEGEEFRRDKKSADGEANKDAAKGRRPNFDRADVLVIEGSSDAVKSALDRLVQEGGLQLASNASGAFDADALANLAAQDFFKNLPAVQQGKGLGAAGFAGGAEAAPSADDQKQKKRGGFANKNEKPERAVTENLKLNEAASENDGKVSGLELGEAKRSRQTGKSDHAAEPEQKESWLPTNGLTLRHLQYGTAEYDDVQREAAVVLERGTIGNNAKELSRKVQPTEDTEKLPGKSRNQSAGDSESPVGKLDQSLIEEKLVRKSQMVRLYILINPHDAVPADAEAAQESPDGK